VAEAGDDTAVVAAGEATAGAPEGGDTLVLDLGIGHVIAHTLAPALGPGEHPGTALPTMRRTTALPLVPVAGADHAAGAVLLTKHPGHWAIKQVLCDVTDSPFQGQTKVTISVIFVVFVNQKNL